MEIKSSSVADSCICKQTQFKKGCLRKKKNLLDHPSQHIYVNYHSRSETCPSIDSAGTTFLYKTLFRAPASGWSALPSCWGDAEFLGLPLSPSACFY